MSEDKMDTAEYVKALCEEAGDEYKIDPKYYRSDSVKRGLRNADGSGVMAGVTRIGLHAFRGCKRLTVIADKGSAAFAAAKRDRVRRRSSGRKI